MTTKSDCSTFGRHVRSLRRARGLTQEVLAERCCLSPDTARRLEHGDFSPSLDTLTKLAHGLDLQLSTLFAGHELGARDIGRELRDLLGQRSPSDLELAMALLRLVFATLDTLRSDAAKEVESDMNGDPKKVRSFGAHIKRLREVRRLTQEELAERSDLAADTIRRLEHQDFSPSLRTLRKVCKGLGLEVARLLSSPEDIDGQLRKILDLVFSILDIDRVALIMIDETTGEFGAPIVESRREMTLGETTGTYSRHILNYVRERSVAALFSDAAADPRLDGAHSIQLTSVRSSMCAPLKPHDDIIGVLYVDNLTIPAVFTNDDLELLSAFAAQAAIAIENSRLYQRLQDEAVARSNLLRFFPPTTIAQLRKNPRLTTEVIDTEVTALFCDISGFTQMSAQMQPRNVMELLNRYFPVITEIVFDHEGTLEKYIGDAMLAVWGAPFRRVDDAKRAVQAAVDMQEAISKLSLELTNFPPLRVHIGLNTGRVAAGNIGSEHYLQYATIGDATNLASRICSAAGPGEIAIGVATLERLGGPPAFPIDGPEFHEVRGRDQPIAVYKLRWED